MVTAGRDGTSSCRGVPIAPGRTPPSRRLFARAYGVHELCARRSTARVRAAAVLPFIRGQDDEPVPVTHARLPRHGCYYLGHSAWAEGGPPGHRGDPPGLRLPAQTHRAVPASHGRHTLVRSNHDALDLALLGVRFLPRFPS